MNHPTQILKISGMLVLFFLLSGTGLAIAQNRLTKIEKKEQVSSTRITFHFDELPVFKTVKSGQRVDLDFTAAGAGEDLDDLPEDEKVVRILLAQKRKSLLVSMLLRRPPVQVVTGTVSKPARVILDLIWEGESSARPGIAFRIADMPARKPGKKASAYGKKSAWQGKWPSFFRAYRSDWKLDIPLVYHPPTLPPLVTDKESPLWLMQMYTNEKMWLSVLREATKKVELDEKQAYLSRLLIAEAQLFSGAIEASSNRLLALQEEQGAEQTRVDYLTAYAQAVDGQSYVAQLSVKEVLTGLPLDHFLVAPIFLLAAETALASNQDRLALNYLHNSEINWPDSYLLPVDLRTADARTGLGERKEAVEIYTDLSEEEGLFEAHRFSCNRGAFAAFKRKDYPLARLLYQKLFEADKDEAGADLALWGQGASTYLVGEVEWGIIYLEKVTLEYPLTEGAERAELLLIDHKVQQQGEMGIARAAADYQLLSERSGSWKVREEAMFKHALSLYLVADYAASVDVLMKFVREFSSSGLKREARLLLLEQIPHVVERLLNDKKELEAVVLVEKNRNLLLHGGPDSKFLADLARAFERLGLYERSSRVLLFLFDQAKNDQQREPIYLPLSRSFYKRGEYAKAGGYASRYLKKYPRGKQAGDLFGVLLDAFEKQGRDEELIAWLSGKKRPRSAALERRAAAFYWQQRRYQGVVDSLEWIRKNVGQLEVKEMALLGEAYYQLDKNRLARKEFKPLLDNLRVGTQARYRTAQLMLRKQERGTALNLLQRLVEEDGDSSWGKLAQDLLIMENNKEF